MLLSFKTSSLAAKVSRFTYVRQRTYKYILLLVTVSPVSRQTGGDPKVRDTIGSTNTHIDSRREKKTKEKQQPYWARERIGQVFPIQVVMSIDMLNDCLENY